MKLSIIIVSYNTKQITTTCIESIYKSLKHLNHDSGEIETIVVDNNSTDGSVEAIKHLQQTYKHINLIQNTDNTGFGKANNQGLSHAQGEYILYLNSDTIVLDNAVETLLRFYHDHEDTIHFLGGKLLNKDRSPQASCGPFFSLPVLFGFLFLKGDHWGLTRYSPDTTIKTGWVSGACILTKKAYMEELNGFDEGIFMYMEEVELLYRAKQHGYDTYFTPEAQFIHLGSASSKKSYPITQAYRGFLYFYKKHHGRSALFVLKTMLQLKALISFGIGKITKNSYLTETYGKAYHMAQMA
jgi:hypothetical protein